MRQRTALALALLFAGLLTAQAFAEPKFVNLVAMKRKYFANCLWSMERTKVGGQEVEGTLAGLGGTEDSIMVYELEDEFDMLEVMVGYLETAPDNRSAVFEVWADGNLMQRAGPMHSGQDAEWMRVPIKGAKMLTLRIVPQRYDSTHGAAWGSAKLWADLKGEIPGSVLLKVNGQSMQAVPSLRGKTREVPVPVPLQPGVFEYRVRVKYDDKTGKAEIETSPLGEEKAEATSPPQGE